jgi:hypothetical protein
MPLHQRGFVDRGRFIVQMTKMPHVQIVVKSELLLNLPIISGLTHTIFTRE